MTVEELISLERGLTVQELIDELQKIEDKSKECIYENGASIMKIYIEPDGYVVCGASI